MNKFFGNFILCLNYPLCKQLTRWWQRVISLCVDCNCCCCRLLALFQLFYIAGICLMWGEFNVAAAVVRCCWHLPCMRFLLDVVSRVANHNLLCLFPRSFYDHTMNSYIQIWVPTTSLLNTRVPRFKVKVYSHFPSSAQGVLVFSRGALFSTTNLGTPVSKRLPKVYPCFQKHPCFQNYWG